ncbi:adenosine deaminase [Lacticaseibacillus pabuli]|uniref:Adenosine deaminase n=1 Tax=Lacticaseibacillus pabuli TaxID=3025672 RepID=A0ABY7WWC7_9LACO|nr:adenosine deaminase [Lacticaseibacillus sp. KACC 23028]WDF83301.1 adenosine deaminase [Lacticaseibacillus sp. KACC 23028]
MLTNAALMHLPKIELHCHLDGSLSLPTIRHLAGMANIAIPAEDADLRKLVTAPKQSDSLLDYLKAFDFIRPLLQTKEALELAAYDVAEQAASENVRYIEIRFAPEFSLDAGLSVPETITAVITGLHRAMADFDIRARLLVCYMRQTDFALNQQIIDQSAPMLGTDLVGGDFAGKEAGFPPIDIRDSIMAAQAAGVPLTLHAGECNCVQNVAQALAMGISRIGHATALANHPDVIAQFVRSGATAEMCLSSNLQTKAAPSIADFPYQEFRDAGVKITINTDNRTVSGTNLTREYRLFQQHFGTTVSDFLEFNQNAVEASFTSIAEKQMLHDRLNREYAELGTVEHTK